MKVSVYYRGAMNKLHQIDAEAEHPAEAIAAVAEELKDDWLVRKPFLALVMGGGSGC